MEFKQLGGGDAGAFASLIINMYNNLDNLEWFSPMPHDEDGVRAILEKDRFFILGCFDEGKLRGVSSFDFYCGKLIGQACLPPQCNLENTAEIGFTMVHSDYRGQGIMKKLISELEKYASLFGKKYLFGKVHIENLASYKSFIARGFAPYATFDKEVKREEFALFLSSHLLKPGAEAKARETLGKNEGAIVVKYTTLVKAIRPNLSPQNS